MSQKQVKRLRRKARDILKNEFSLINDDVAKELNDDDNIIAEWLPLALTARIILPEKNIREFLPSNFINIYFAILIEIANQPNLEKMIEEDKEFLSKVFEFAQEFSINRSSLNLNNTSLPLLSPIQIHKDEHLLEEDFQELSLVSPEIVNLFKAVFNDIGKKGI